MKTFEVMPVADGGYLVADDKESSRYDFELRLRGPVSLADFNEIKSVLGFTEKVTANSRREALQIFLKNPISRNRFKEYTPENPGQQSV